MGERIFVDTTGTFPESFMRNWYWIVVLEDYRNYFWSSFTKTKLQLTKKMDYFFKKSMLHGNLVKYLHCYNVGEHQ